MKRQYSILIFLMMVVTLVSCNKNEKLNNDEVLQEQGQVSMNYNFPERYEKVVDKVEFETQIKIDNSGADSKYVNSTATLQKVDVDKAFELFYSNINDYETYEYDQEDEYGNPTKSITYVDKDETTIEVGLYSSYFSYSNKRLSPYIMQTFRMSEKYEDYNADKYSLEEQLDFKSREDAFNDMKHTLSDINIEIDNEYKAYALDYRIMKEEEYSTDIYGNEDKESYKSEWTSNDDCYYFAIGQEYLGLPVYHVYNQYFTEKSDENAPIQLIYSKDGIEYLSIERIFKFNNEEDKEVKLAEFDDVSEVISKKYNNILGNSSYKVMEAELNYMVDVFSGNGKYEVKPVWIVNIQESTPEGVIGNLQVIIDAVTAEEIV